MGWTMPDGDDGRVTLAILKTTIEMQGKETRRELERLAAQLAASCAQQMADHDALVTTRGLVTDHAKEIDALRKRDLMAGGLGGLVAVATAILGALIGRNP